MKRIILIATIFFIIQIGFTQNIQVHYLGHSSFVIQFDDIPVVTDYGKPNAWKDWGWDSQIHGIGELIPDIMTYSHLHEDHYDSTRIPKGVKYILKNGEELDYNQLKVEAIPTCEEKFGEFNNTSYWFSYKGYNIVHTGDIQGMIANIENDTIGNYFEQNFPEKIDVLIFPVEGRIKYIPQIEKFVQLLNPKIAIPCHYWSQEYLDEFVTFFQSKRYPFKVTKKSRFKLHITNDKISDIIVLERSLFE